MEFGKTTLTFKFVDEILWCDHSNESSLPVLSYSAICFSKCYKMKFANLVEICLWLHLAVKGLIKSDDYYSGMFPLPRWRTRGNGRTWWTRWTRGNRRTRRDWRPWAIRGAPGNGRNARLAMKKTATTTATNLQRLVKNKEILKFGLS